MRMRSAVLVWACSEVLSVPSVLRVPVPLMGSVHDGHCRFLVLFILFVILSVRLTPDEAARSPASHQGRRYYVSLSPGGSESFSMPGRAPSVHGLAGALGQTEAPGMSVWTWLPETSVWGSAP